MSRRARSRAACLALALLPAAAFAQASPSPFTAGYRYDSERRLTGTIAPDPDGSGPLRHAAVRNGYDPAGRLVKVEKGELAQWQSEAVAPASWTGFTIATTVDSVYDALGRKLSELLSGADGAKAFAQTRYDPLGRVLCTAVRMNPGAFGAQTDACLPGPAGGQGADRIARHHYDKAGQLTRVERAVGTDLRQDYAHYEYSGNGKRTALVDANGNRAEMTYDRFDRQAMWVFPSNAPGAANPADYEEYGYDSDGNRTSLRKRDGSVLTFQYDALDRMIARIVPERSGLAAAQTRDVHYDYDLRGLRTKARFDSLSDEGITSGYDGFGRLIWTNTNQSGPSRTLQFAYHADGSRERIVHADGAAFGYLGDSLGRVTQHYEINASPSMDDHVVRYWYDPAGNRSAAVRGAGAGGFYTIWYRDSLDRPAVVANDFPSARDMVVELAYNAASQIVTRSVSNDSYAAPPAADTARGYQVNGLNQYTGTTWAGSPNWSFEYDPNGNLKRSVDPVGTATTAYLYDVENRLVAASGAANAGLVYDPLGRLFQVTNAAR